MAKHKFTSENQPETRRTRNKLTLVLEAIQDAELLGTNPETSKENVEKAVFKFLAQTAFYPTEENASLAAPCLNLLIKKAWPDSKPAAEKVEFSYDRADTAANNAHRVIEKVASGEIPPDIGQMLIGMIKDSIAINESTELVKRLEELEQMLKK